MRIPALVAMTASLAAVACGGSGSAGGTPISAQDFPARFASAWCSVTMKCCRESGGTSDPACETQVAAEMTTRGSGATADGATWNAAAAGQCLDMLGRADCGSTDAVKLVAILGKCDDIWTGIVPPGGACMDYSSCAEPAVSGGASAGASCVNSACVQVVREPVGAACSTATTMLCDPLLAVCSAGVCMALPTDGQSCTGSCRSGSGCVGGVCMPLQAPGAACAANSDCASNRCVAGKCASVLAVSADYCTLP